MLYLNVNTKACTYDDRGKKILSIKPQSIDISVSVWVKKSKQGSSCNAVNQGKSGRKDNRSDGNTA